MHIFIRTDSDTTILKMFGIRAFSLLRVGDVHQTCQNIYFEICVICITLLSSMELTTMGNSVNHQRGKKKTTGRKEKIETRLFLMLLPSFQIARCFGEPC